MKREIKNKKNEKGKHILTWTTMRSTIVGKAFRNNLVVACRKDI